MAKILIVDDDIHLNKVLSSVLIKEKHAVDSVCNGEEALNFLLAEKYDLVVLDIAMPGTDGMSVCKRYRESGGQSKILMLTGKRSQEDKISGLDMGADDYLTKPFDTRELLSRIKALLRRPHQVQSSELTFGSLTLNSDTHEIRICGELMPLAPREFSLLEFFVRNPERTVSAESVLERVWPSDSETTIDAVRNSVNRLRSMLRKFEQSKVELLTIYGVGYKLTCRD